MTANAGANSGGIDAAFTTGQLAERVGGELIGPGDLTITGIDQLDEAGPTQISFIRNEQHARRWPDSSAGAAVVDRGVALEPGDGRALIRVPDADLATVVLLDLFAPPIPGPPQGVHPSATVDPTAELGADIAIGPGCVIGARVRVGPSCRLHAGVHLYDDVTLGRDCELFAGVVVRERCQIGDAVIVHPNAVIGADGFGYRPASDGSALVKIPQIGTVRIADRVEVGAGTCIDRGKFSATTIGEGTKIDNLCQIGHNCRIGNHCVIAGQNGLAGGVTLDDWVMLGGQVGIIEHVTIGRAAKVGAKSLVTRDVPPGETWSGTPAHPTPAVLREYAALRRLPKLVRSMRARPSGDQSEPDADTGH